MVLVRSLAVAFGILVASAVTPVMALAASPNARDFELLHGRLERTTAVRVTGSGRTLVLERPVLSSEGIGYSKARGFPRTRTALFVGADWDSVPPPPRFVPWSHVERIERRSYGYSPIAVVGIAGGAALGACAGLVLGAVINTENWLGVAAWTVPPLALLGGVGGGHVVGRYEKWDPVWP